mgnify:CR=1 FL=1
MKPYNERTVDTQYRDMLKKILEEGAEVLPIHGEKSKMLIGMQMRFDMNNGFPMITERNLSDKFMKGALGEHIGFLHGARTHEALAEWGCPWWNRWVTKEKCEIFGLPEGDLGPGSYGAAWANFPTAEGEAFNQIEHLIKQIKERPYLRTHFVSPWIPQYTLQHAGLIRKVVVAPCHGWLHLMVFPETKEISLHHFQRSGDTPVGVPFNMIQYGAFLMMVAQVTGLKPGTFVHTLGDAHLYDNHLEQARLQLSREPRPLPTMRLNPAVKDLFALKFDDFELLNYDPHPHIKAPVAV